MRRALQVIAGLIVLIVGTVCLFMSLSGAVNFFWEIIPISNTIANLVFGNIEKVSEAMTHLSGILISMVGITIESFVYPIYYISALFVLGKIFTIKGLNYILDCDEPIADNMEGFIFWNTDNL